MLCMPAGTFNSLPKMPLRYLMYRRVDKVGKIDHKIIELEKQLFLSGFFTEASYRRQSSTVFLF